MKYLQFICKVLAIATIRMVSESQIFSMIQKTITYIFLICDFSDSSNTNNVSDMSSNTSEESSDSGNYSVEI